LMWGLFGVLCGLLVTIVVLVLTLRTGAPVPPHTTVRRRRHGSRTLFFTLIALAFTGVAVMMFTNARRRGVTAAWRYNPGQRFSMAVTREARKAARSRDALQTAREMAEATRETAVVIKQHYRQAADAIADSAREIRATAGAVGLTERSGETDLSLAVAMKTPAEHLPDESIADVLFEKARRKHGAVASIRRSAVLGSLVTAAAIALLLYLGYLLLDASTRGHFTWPLRILSVVAFVTLFAAVVLLRQQ
ncbi:MAG: hypothetical protein ACE5EX_01345, partial [Phycisphaerae bacterium]